MDAEIINLRNALVGEIFNALGFSKTGSVYRSWGWIFQKPANRLATIGVTADRMISSNGFAEAATWMLTNWCKQVTARGTENVPQQGPLLVVSNHAGSYDTFVIASKLGREDLNLISSDIPFFKMLPNATRHMFFLSDNTHDRMNATRAGIRHLKEGGALLIYGTGLIDPDLEVYPDAAKHLDTWSSSVDLFLRQVPDTRVLVTICSGVLAKSWGYHPITWFKKIDWQKRRLAEFGQVIQQLVLPGSLYLSPHISFAQPAGLDELLSESGTGRILPALIARAKGLMAEHQKWVNQVEIKGGTHG